MGNVDTVVEVVRNLKPGEVVTLPDGEKAIVIEQHRDEVSVIQPQKFVGKGPWVYACWQLDAVAA